MREWSQMNKEDYQIDRDVCRLFTDEPFYALLSRQLDKRPDPTIKTAGVKYNPDLVRYELVYNPMFMAAQSDIHKRWVLKHELAHISLGHCTTRKLENVDRKTANQAMDLAINSLPNMIGDAPHFVLMPKREPFEEIELFGMASEWYAKWIKKDKEENPEKYQNEGDGQFDDHSDFGSSDSSSEEDEMGKQIAGKKITDAIAKAANECDFGDSKGGSPKGWGSVSQQQREIIKDNIKNQFKLDPKKVLASFIKASIAADRKTSVTKRSRRLPGRKFGKRSEHRANVAISIDQSGSVSDELLSKVFGWLGEFAKFASFTVVPFDHQVFEKKVYVWKKGDKKKKERVLHGGTDFNAPTKYVNERTFDGHIIITDMMAPKPIRSKCQRMWLTDKRGSSWASFKPMGERMLILDG